MEEKTKYVGIVNGQRFVANSKKKYILKYLQKLVNFYKGFETVDRILHYVEYFCSNFKYDKNMRDNLLNNENFIETFEENEDNLFRLFYKKKGVCMQFAQALSLLSAIDREITHDMVNFYFTTFSIIVDGKKMGHTVNTIQLKDTENFVIDISSMLHAIDGEFKQDKNAFNLVYLKDYISNLKKEGIRITPVSKDSKQIYLTCYSCEKLSIDEYYRLLNLPTIEIIKNHQKDLFKIDIN